MKCWYCKKNKMEPDESLGKGWKRCSNCGATDNDPLPGIGGTLSKPSQGARETLKALYGDRGRK